MKSVRLVGSRAEGHAHAFSDWDIYVQATDFPRIAEDLPSLVEPFRPLAQLWDPYSDHEAYMLVFPGPAKVDVCFFDEPRQWSPAWEARPETIEAIDRHFWDWILWTEQKRRGGHADKVAKSLADMYDLMLAPIGVESPPASVPDALEAYLDARDRLERRFEVRVSRAAENAVRPAVSS